MNQMPLSLVFIIFLFTVVGCSSTQEIDSSSAEGAYKLGEIYRKDERYQDSIAQFEVVKNKFPYSRLATMAELQIADINYDREAYIEAQNAYQIFKELHPGHEKIDYVTYRLALSFFMQLPDSIDRDLTLAEQAVLYFDEVIHSYPTSEYVAPAQEKKAETLKKLAQKELYIAHFYFIREMFDSSLGRYEDLLRKYPKLGFDEEALYGAILSSAHVKDLRKRDFYFEKLKKNHPDSKWTRQAQQELADGIE